MQHRAIRSVCTALLLSLLVGCGEGFDPPSEVSSLRLLGLRKDKSLAEPGETVNLELLWHDGSLEPLSPPPQRDIQFQWITGCTNPENRSYTGCFEQFARALECGDGDDCPNLEIQTGERASFVVDPDVLATAPPIDEEGQPLYGRSYVFVTACAGTVSIERPKQEGALPLVCTNGGERMGPDSFVVAYAAIYTYGGALEDGTPFRNGNPIVQGFEAEGEAAKDFCIDGDCLSAEAPPVECAEDPNDPNDLCFPTCEGDGDEADCPEIDIRPLVDRASAEPDDVARVYYGRSLEEQLWINYYVDRGSVRGDGVRLLNDATTGWNDDYGTEFFAPKEPGPVTVWAVVRDNRGGQSWVRTQLQIVAPKE